MHPDCPACGGALSCGPDSLGGFPLLRCRRCGTRYADSAAGVDADYDAIYDTREYLENQVRMISTENPESFARIATYRPFFRRIHPGDGRTLLDVGCGVGRFALAAHRRGWRVSGVDVSTAAVQIGAEATRLPLRATGVEDLVREADRYHVVTAFEVLEHLSSPRALLESIRALLLANGEVFVTVPNWRNPQVRTAARPDWTPPVHRCFFTKQGLISLLRRVGFSDVRAGVIWTHPPVRSVRFPGWLAGRMLRPGAGLGLWAHGRVVASGSP